MPYDGFLSFDGVALVYANRTARMAREKGLGWFTPQDTLDWDPISTIPRNAPWYDSTPTFADVSLGYCGMVVTSMTPMENSFAIRDVVPLARGGAALGLQYNQHREVVVAAALIAQDRRSAVYGLEWLWKLLHYGQKCGTSKYAREGYAVEWWAWEPPHGERSGAHQRFMYDCQVTSGPTVLRERDIGDGCGHIIDIEFTITAGNPGLYSQILDFTDVATQVRDDYNDIPILAPNGGNLAQKRHYDDLDDMIAVGATTYDQIVEALITFSTGVTVQNGPPPPPPVQVARDWWEDPACPPLPDPPGVPSTTDLVCHPTYTGQVYQKVWTLHQGTFPDWHALALRADVVARGTALHDVDLLFTRPAVGGSPAQAIRFVVSHVPEDGVLRLDGIRDKITMVRGGVEVEAGHLVSRSRTGDVFIWPLMDCGPTWTLTASWPKALGSDAVVVNAAAAVKYV